MVSALDAHLQTRSDQIVPLLVILAALLSLVRTNGRALTQLTMLAALVSLQRRSNLARHQ